MPRIPKKFKVTACVHMLEALGMTDGQEKHTEIRVSADAEPWWGTGVYKQVECDEECLGREEQGHGHG